MKAFKSCSCKISLIPVLCQCVTVQGCVSVFIYVLAATKYHYLVILIFFVLIFLCAQFKTKLGTQQENANSQFYFLLINRRPVSSQRLINVVIKPILFSWKLNFVALLHCFSCFRKLPGIGGKIIYFTTLLRFYRRFGTVTLPHPPFLSSPHDMVQLTLHKLL